MIGKIPRPSRVRASAHRLFWQARPPLRKRSKVAGLLQAAPHPEGDAGHQDAEQKRHAPGPKRHAWPRPCAMRGSSRKRRQGGQQNALRMAPHVVRGARVRGASCGACSITNEKDAVYSPPTEPPHPRSKLNRRRELRSSRSHPRVGASVVAGRLDGLEHPEESNLVDEGFSNSESSRTPVEELVITDRVHFPAHPGRQ